MYFYIKPCETFVYFLMNAKKLKESSEAMMSLVHPLVNENICYESLK